MHLAGMAVRRYSKSKVRKTPVRRRHWSGCDEIPHVQGQRRSPIKMVKVKVMSLSRVRLFVTPWTVAHQAPPSMGLSRQEYWSGLPLPSPGDLPNPGIEPRSPALPTDTLTFDPPGKPQQDGRRSEFTLRIHAVPARDAQRAQTNCVRTRTQGPHRD